MNDIGKWNLQGTSHLRAVVGCNHLQCLESSKPGMFQSNWEGGCFRHVIPSLKLTASLPLKIDGWKLEDAISFLGWPMFNGEMLVSGRVQYTFFWLKDVEHILLWLTCNSVGTKNSLKTLRLQSWA